MKDEQNELNEPQAQYAPKVQKEIETEQELIKERVSLEEYLEMIADGEQRLEYQ